MENNKEVLETVIQMEENKERLYLEVEYIKSYIQFRSIFINKLTSCCFFIWYIFANTRNLTEDKVSGRGMDYLVVSDLKKFANAYEKKCYDTKWMAQLESKEKSVDITEALFIKLVHHRFLICGLFPEVKDYSAGQVSDIILDFIKRYIKVGSVDDIIIMTFFMVFVADIAGNNNKSAVQAE